MADMHRVTKNNRASTCRRKRLTFKLSQPMFNPCPPSHWRFTEKNFRKYEPIIHQLTLSYPEKPVWFVMPGSLNTHVARVRDAINTFIHNKFHSEIDYDKFIKAWPNVFVKHNGEMIFIGTQTQWQTTQSEAPQQAIISNLFDGISIPNPPIEAIQAFMILMNLDLLNKTSIKFTQADPDIMSQLESLSSEYPNIIIDILDETTFVML